MEPETRKWLVVFFSLAVMFFMATWGVSTALNIVSRVTSQPQITDQCPKRYPAPSRDVGDYEPMIREADIVFVGRVRATDHPFRPATPEAWESLTGQRPIAVYVVDVVTKIKGEPSPSMRIGQLLKPAWCMSYQVLSEGQMALFMVSTEHGIPTLEPGAFQLLLDSRASADTATMVATVLAWLSGSTPVAFSTP